MRSITSIIETGFSGALLQIECRLSNSLPQIVIVGFTHRSVTESKERIRGALASSNIKLPPRRITVNLAPADIPKHGSSFDLPILMAILQAVNPRLTMPNTQTVILGEVGLDGSIRPIRGIIGKVMAAKALGITSFWIPQANVAQANLVPGVNIYGFDTVKQLYEVLLHGKLPAESYHDLPAASPLHQAYDEVSGQASVKRAMVIAAAGQHNMLINGAPGTGKTMLAKQLLHLLPSMNTQEILETTHIHSLHAQSFDQIITSRPFRTPHHSTTATTILGSNASLRPGEISLSHNGVLFLDELSEFKREAIEGLREPLENHQISLVGNRGRSVLPAHFLLIGTTNPCPCGYYGSDKACICSAQQRNSYQQKLSGPLLDRIDLYCETEPVAHAKLLADKNPSLESSILHVLAARQLQLDRSGKTNNLLTNRELKDTIKLQPKARLLLENAAITMRLSARSYMRTLRVARTVADLESSPTIELTHVGEALQYRYKPPGSTA